MYNKTTYIKKINKTGYEYDILITLLYMYCIFVLFLVLTLILSNLLTF